MAIRITDLDPYRDTGKTCLGGGMHCPSTSRFKSCRLDTRYTRQADCCTCTTTVVGERDLVWPVHEGQCRVLKSRVELAACSRAETVAGTVQGSISVTVGNVCSRGGGQLHTDYTEEVLEYRIEVNYLTPSFHDLSSDVTVSDCGAGGRRRRGANDVIVTVVIVGVYESVSLTYLLTYRLTAAFSRRRFTSA